MDHLLGYSRQQLREWFTQRDMPPFRADQVLRWAYDAPGVDFGQMSNLPKPLRQRLEETFQLWSMRGLTHRSAADGTEKLLLETADGHRVECVLLRDDKGNRTVCISTQVGCAMGCVFCASGLDGVERNLTAGEILEEILQLKRLLAAEERLSHIVVMGMGEPMANLDGLLPALAIATHPKGLGISARRVTISTVGLPAAMRRLAEADVSYHLAVSLHAPNDQLRNRIVPVNAKVGIAEVLRAADDYFQRTGRRVTYEYVLLAEVNDHPEHAQELGQLLAGRNALVNLIPYNPIRDLPYRTPRRERVARFAEILSELGIQVTIRHRKGDAIDAACGQLRRSQGR